MTKAELFAFLEEQYLQYNRLDFIESDPVSVPHLFKGRQDIEIAGFMSATIAWGNRKSIVSNALKLMTMTDMAPHAFLMNAKPHEFRPFLSFVHRTFNGDDCLFFLASLKNIYARHGTLEPLFSSMNSSGAAHAIGRFRGAFLETDHLPRSEKHLANPAAGSAAKRINMFLRWMVRVDSHGVDFGLWKSIDPASLVIPLDVHTGRVARALGLLQRTQNDWKSALELTQILRQFDPADPVKYDYALFGTGVNPRTGKW